MSQVRLSKSLYRFVNRWTRHTSVKNSILALDPVRFGAMPAVLKEAGHVPGTLVTSGKEVMSLARTIFRLPLAQDKASETINSFINELPRWNAERAVITQKYEIRLNNQKPEILAHRTYSVGEVVSHKDTQIRHIVVGWEVENGKQYLQTLSDHLDAQNTLERGTTTPAGAASFDTTATSIDAEHTDGRLRGEPASDFEKVTNPHLLRVINETSHDYFEGFDVISGRYIPNNQLCFMFPADIKEPETGMEESIARKAQQLHYEKQMRYVMNSVGGMLDVTTERITEILNRYEINTDNLAEAAAKATAANTAPGVSGTNNTAEEAVKLIMDSPYKHIHALQQISKKIKASSASLQAPVSGDRKAFEGISSLGALLIDIEKMLHLRWQAKGHVHFEEEMQHRLDWATSQALLPAEERTAIQPLKPTFEVPIYRLGEVVRTKKWGWKGTIISIHLRPDSPDAAKWDGVANTPSGAEQPFYRVLPDEADLSEGASILARLVAEENMELVDTSEQPPAHAHRFSMKASDANAVTPATTTSTSASTARKVDAMLQTWHVQNRLMHRYFTGFDIEQGRYIPKQKLHFVFPDSVYDVAADDEDIASVETATATTSAESKSATPSLKDIPWLPKLENPGSRYEAIAAALKKTVSADEVAETATSSIAEMESNLKNILAAVNAKQVNRIRKERHQRAIKRNADLGLSEQGTSMASMQEESARGQAVAEAVLMEIYRVVKRVFSMCRERSTASLPATATAPHGNFLKIPFPDPLTEFASDKGDTVKIVDDAGAGYELPPVHVRSDDGVPLLHMSHLSFLLRTARRREDALSIESIMWKVWMAHDNWRVSTEMIQGAQCIQSGKLSEALTFFQNAAEMDPAYSEPYNKMAASSLRLEKYDDCVNYATKSLEMYPLHYAALAGLGTALEKNGKLEESAQCLERCLEAHPFAGHVPTFVQTVLRRLDAERLQKVQKILLAAEEMSARGKEEVKTNFPAKDDVATGLSPKRNNGAVAGSGRRQRREETKGSARSRHEGKVNTTAAGKDAKDVPDK